MIMKIFPFISNSYSVVKSKGGVISSSLTLVPTTILPWVGA